MSKDQIHQDLLSIVCKQKPIVGITTDYCSVTIPGIHLNLGELCKSGSRSREQISIQDLSQRQDALLGPVSLKSESSRPIISTEIVP